MEGLIVARTVATLGVEEIVGIIAVEHARPLVMVGWGLGDLDEETRGALATATSDVESIDEVEDAVRWAMGHLA